jgi:hypothetical protein
MLRCKMRSVELTFIFELSTLDTVFSVFIADEKEVKDEKTTYGHSLGLSALFYFWLPKG